MPPGTPWDAKDAYTILGAASAPVVEHDGPGGQVSRTWKQNAELGVEKRGVEERFYDVDGSYSHTAWYTEAV